MLSLFIESGAFVTVFSFKMYKRKVCGKFQCVQKDNSSLYLITGVRAPKCTVRVVLIISKLNDNGTWSTSVVILTENILVR